LTFSTGRMVVGGCGGVCEFCKNLKNAIKHERFFPPPPATYWSCVTWTKKKRPPNNFCNMARFFYSTFSLSYCFGLSNSRKIRYFTFRENFKRNLLQNSLILVKFSKFFRSRTVSHIRTHFYTSTHQHINTSTHQHINTSTHQHINRSTHQHINTSTHQHINTSTHQQINTSTHQHINTSTH